MNNLRKAFLSIALASVLGASPSLAQVENRVEKNVVYGMVSGAALLMDVYYPEESNRRGVLFVQGSGFYWPSGYSAGHLKEAEPVMDSIPALVEHGFTVFAANHRLAPAFQYPSHIQDLRRAVRFIKANASRFGIVPEALGAYGTSAGATLVGLLGLQDGGGDLKSNDPVERLSSKVQAVVARCGFLDLTAMDVARDVTFGYAFMFLGEPKMSGNPGDQHLSEIWVEASPVTYISADDPPIFVSHAMDDPAASYESMEIGLRKLQTAGLDVEFVPRGTGGHCAGDVPHEQIVEWLEAKLINHH